MLTLVLLATAAAQPPATHEAANPLYKSLLDPGVEVGPNIKAKLPPPTMPDGLDAAKQKAAVKALIGNDYDFDEFTRNSVVAPYVLKLRDVAPSDPNAPARGVDAWFVIHGDLRALDDEKFLESLLSVGRGDGKGDTITKEDLAQRKITVADEKKEGYGHIAFDFIDKVRIRATGRAMWSKTAESVVVAVEVDPRFKGDKKFPNDWAPITLAGGVKKYGETTPWAGSGLYLKLTKLAEPKGALFCEQHVIFAEPKGWFDDANLLRSKLPLAVQNNVRSMRKEWARYEQK
jgi:hypothetical protein